MLGAAVLHAAVPLTNDRVRKLGQNLKCKCGCNASITDCNMINCHFSDPVRMKLLAMVDSGGKSDKEIIDAIAAEYGRDILLNPPTEGVLRAELDDAIYRTRRRRGGPVAGAQEVPRQATR